MSSALSRPSTGGDDSLSAGVIACAIVSLVIAAVAVAARFYTRAVIIRALAPEDWFVLAAWFLSIGYTVCQTFQAKSALGHHIWTIDPEDFVVYGKTSWAGVLFYQLSLACSKISILLLYLRVLTYDYARRAAWVLFAIVILYNTLGFFSTMTLCVPLEALWNKTVEGNCHLNPAYMWIAIIFHIVTDFLIFALPVPVVVLMTVPLSQRVMLLLIFALGFLVCIISVLRAIWINALLSSVDPTWDFVAVSNWTSVEINAAVVCACLLATKPLIARLWRKMRGSASTERSATTLDGRGPPTIGSESVRGSNRLPSGSGASERGYGSDRALVRDLEDAIMPMRDVGQQYAAAMREVAGGRGKGKEEV